MKGQHERRDQRINLRLSKAERALVARAVNRIASAPGTLGRDSILAAARRALRIPSTETGS